MCLGQSADCLGREHSNCPCSILVKEANSGTLVRLQLMKRLNGPFVVWFGGVWWAAFTRNGAASWGLGGQKGMGVDSIVQTATSPD